MTNSSTEYINNIDQNYPIAGKNNSSQGFRDNFRNIKQGLKFLDIDAFSADNNSLLLSNNINDFQNNILKRPQFRDSSNKVYDESTIIQLTDFVIDYENGHYQKFTLSSGTHFITLLNFPTDNKSGSILVSINTNSNFNTYISFDEEILYFKNTIFPLQLVGDNPHLFNIINENNNFYLNKIKNDNNITGLLNIKNYVNTLSNIENVSTGSVIFLTGNINSIAYSNNNNWFQISSELLVIDPVTTVISVSILDLNKDALMTPTIPISGNSGYLPIYYNIDKDLPTGLNFNTSTGQITGTPTIFQSTSEYNISVIDALGNTSSKSFSLSVQ